MDKANQRDPTIRRDCQPSIANQWDNIRRAATINDVMNKSPTAIHQAALAWAKTYYRTEHAVIHILQEDDDEPDRYLALIAAANQTGWQAAEVWLEDGAVVAINDLGEGIPPDGVAWPW